MVECGVLDDDKHVSFSFLPPLSMPILSEHHCEITAIDLGANDYFEKVKENENKKS